MLIDEYDYSINKSLSDAEGGIQNTHEENSTTLVKQQSLFKRFFSEMKTKLGEGGVGRIYITGAIPISLTCAFNISKNISFGRNFEGMCGVLECEIQHSLQQIIPSNNLLQEEAMEILKNNYKGYKFNSGQETDLYNTAVVVYFLDFLSEFKKIPSNLNDPTVQLSRLDILIKYPLAKEIIYELYSNAEKFYYYCKIIYPILATEKMTQLLQKDPLYTLSFLYYMGALTQSKLSKDLTGTEFRIPNKLIESEFVGVIQKSLGISDKAQFELCQSILRFVKDYDIQPICVLMKEVLKPLNEVYENAISVAFLLSFKLSGFKTREIELEEEDQKYAKWTVLVVPDQKIHIQFENIEMNNLLFPDSNCDMVVKKEMDEMSQEEILRLKLKEPIHNRKSENLLGKDLFTVGEVFENLKLQTMKNEKYIEHKLGKKIHSFYVLRVGLHSLIHGKIESIIPDLFQSK
jgi:hypothetical protein